MAENKPLSEEEITKTGNPAKPEGEAGSMMLKRMNDSHYEVTGWALNFFHFTDHDAILDIGCGGGRTLHRMSDRSPQGKLIGVDYSPVSVEESTRTNAEDVASGKIQILQGSVDQLPLADDSFDRIITVESFYFWPDAVKDLKEVRRVLKTGGQFLLVADIYNRDDLPASAVEHIQEYNMRNPSLDEFRSYFEQAGFGDITIHLKNGTTWVAVEGTK